MALKMEELREKDQGSLVSMEKELTESLFAARLQKRTGQLENVGKIAQTKRDLARVKTILRARELGLEVIETGKPVEKKEKKADKPRDEKKPVAKPEAKKAKGAKAPAKSDKKKAAKPAAKKAGKSAGKKK